MYSLKNKLDFNLKKSLDEKEFKYYRVIVHYKSYSKKLENRITNYNGHIINFIHSLKCFSAIVTSSAIQRLIEYPEIDFICIDKAALLCSYKNIIAANRITYKTNYKLTGEGIGIALIDTGVYPHHDITRPINKISHFVDIINNIKYPYDDNGHGTFMSGILCGNFNSSEGTCGIAPDSHIYCVKAFNKLGRGYASDILYSIQQIIEEKQTYNIRVLCLPFEFIDNDYYILSLFSEILKIAKQENIISVVPAGHNGNAQNSIRGIAVLKDCITVGGLNTDSYNINPYISSSGGPYKNYQKPDLSAACVNIYSLNCDTHYISEKNGIKLYPKHLDNLYTCYTGTSCACAYIAGLCAVLLQNKKDLNFDDILSLFNVSCNLLNIPKHIQGLGMVDINKLMP